MRSVPPGRSADRPAPLRPRALATVGALLPVLAIACVPASVSAAPATDPSAPWFLRYPTDQLGVPGAIETGELTPNGSLFTGRLELALRAGPALRPWRGGPRALDETGLPVYRWAQRIRDVDVRATAFAVQSSGVPVVHLRVAVSNRTRVPRRFGIGLDSGFLGEGLTETVKGDEARAPYRFPRNIVPSGVGLLEQPGDPYDPTWTSTWSGPVLLRSGAPLLVARVSPSGSAQRRSGPSSRPDAVTGRLRLRGTLRPGARRTVDVVVPLRAVPEGHPALGDRFGPALARLRAAWRPVLRRGMQLSTPEPAVDRAFRAGILTMLVSRHRLPDGRWVQTPNKFQYQASWIRDTTMIAHGLDLLGFSREAGQDVEFHTRWQGPDGLLRSRVGQLDGMGQALWSYGDHVERSGDLALAERLVPSADAAMAWVRGRLDADPRWVLPPSDPKDDSEHAVGHSAGDLLWLAGGTRRVVALAEALGDGHRAAEWSRIAGQVGAIARDRLRESARDGVVPPVLDNPAGRRWGEMWLAWPTGVLGPRDPLVTTTMAAARRDEREGLALWGGRLHLYLGLRRLHTELRAGRPARTIEGLYATLAHLTSTGGTWEQASRPYGTREVYRALGPHAWASADLLALLHDMVVREDGDEIRLLDAVPPAWLRPDATTRVRRAATVHGPVDLELRATSTGATLRWDADVPAGTPLRFRAPAGVTKVRLPGVAPGVRELRLPARRGALRLRWTPTRATRRAPDAESTSAALRAAYATRRGRR